jgi:hypothetical protein
MAVTEHLTDYLREQADRFRELARLNTDPNVRRQLNALAVRCEELALTIVEGPSFKRRQG